MMKDIEKEFRLQVWHGILTGKIYLTQGQYLIHIIKELNLSENKKKHMLETLTELIKP